MLVERCYPDWPAQSSSQRGNWRYLEPNGATITGEDKKKCKFRNQAPVAAFPLEINGSVTLVSMSDFGPKLNCQFDELYWVMCIWELSPYEDKTFTNSENCAYVMSSSPEACLRYF